ncbi:hypothetical protein H5410_030307 [Solanum commersonii]|uniref:CCHC-type domain-containing protein n=1 Tax=Solanum commersonii TaxID=4109 RepID=A0A9J5YFA6_SOLCO|nr:hypothetical protein H5410_030307 [Solanum commersonii]
MPPRRVVKGRPARRNVEEQELPNALEVQPQGEVTNAEFCEAIRMLSQVVTNQAGSKEKLDRERLILQRFVEEEKLRDREEFKNKKAKIGNESGQQKSNANRSSFQQKQKGHATSSSSAPAPKNKGEYYGQNSRAKPAYSQGSMAQGGSKPPTCAKCYRYHSSVYHEGSTSCFKCGQSGHFMRECPKNK